MRGLHFRHKEISVSEAKCATLSSIIDVLVVTKVPKKLFAAKRMLPQKHWLFARLPQKHKLLMRGLRFRHKENSVFEARSATLSSIIGVFVAKVQKTMFLRQQTKYIKNIYFMHFCHKHTNYR